MATLLVTGVGGPAGCALGEQLVALGANDPELRWVGVDVVGVHSPDYPVTGPVQRADGPGYADRMRTAFAQDGPTWSARRSPTNCHSSP